MGDVGVIVNPWAGKDVRRLHAQTGHTADSAKVGVVHRVAAGALAAGAARVLVARDAGRIAERAASGLEGVSIVDGPGTGSSLDTRVAAAQLRDAGCDLIVVLGGDGTCRDAVLGWPELAMIPISTGTNNVFPSIIDATSAGTAAGLVASGAIAVGAVRRRAKVLDVDVWHGDASTHTIALVDVALIDAADVGARAVVTASSVRAVVAAIASPASTGLSCIAGRVHPVGRDDDGAVAVWLGSGDREVRVPLMPGRFDIVSVARVDEVTEGTAVHLDGPGVLAFDGERDLVLGQWATAAITVRRAGPWIIDVESTLRCAAALRLFDLEPATDVEAHRAH